MLLVTDVVDPEDEVVGSVVLDVVTVPLGEVELVAVDVTELVAEVVVSGMDELETDEAWLVEAAPLESAKYAAAPATAITTTTTTANTAVAIPLEDVCK